MNMSSSTSSSSTASNKAAYYYGQLKKDSTSNTTTTTTLVYNHNNYDNVDEHLDALVSGKTTVIRTGANASTHEHKKEEKEENQMEDGEDEQEYNNRYGEVEACNTINGGGGGQQRDAHSSSLQPQQHQQRPHQAAQQASNDNSATHNLAATTLQVDVDVEHTEHYQQHLYKLNTFADNDLGSSSSYSSGYQQNNNLRSRLALNQQLYGIATLSNRYQFHNPLLDIEPDTRDPRTESLPRGLQGVHRPTAHKKRFWNNKSGGGGGGASNIYQRSLSIFANGVSPLLRKRKANKHATAAADEEVYQAGGLKIDPNFTLGLSRSRRQSEPMFSYDSITNELSAREEHIKENINLDLERMLMVDAGGPGANVGGANGSEYGSHHHSNVFVGSSAVSPSSPNELNTAAALRHQLKLATMQYNQQLRSNKDMDVTYGRAMNQQQQQQQQHQQPVSYKEPLYMCYDETGARSKNLAATGGGGGNVGLAGNHYQSGQQLAAGHHNDDNIYEEIDFLTIASLRAQYADTLSLQSYKNNKKGGSKRSLASSSFTRWFSTRKKASPSMSEDENSYIDIKITKKQRPPIMLPEAPADLSKEQLKRRYIVGSIVDSENSYINSLQRIINCYKKPLEDGNGTILSTNKVNIIFHRLEQILQCHTIFGIALSQCVREWDEKETIGDVFIASFSKSMVLDIYSDFINNFTNAMETARKAAKSKSAFAQFLQTKSLSSPDRLSFFGLMVKPVQRFPQFILLLTDLLKHTPADHHDRMSLQLALTQLESLADRLNERKRDAERHFAVRQLLKDYLSSSTTSSSHRFLLRQDDVYQLDLDTGSGVVLKTKLRKLYLLNDMLVCVSLPANRLKFAVSLLDVDVMDDVKPATTNLVANAVLKKDPSSASTSPKHCTVERMYCDLNSLLHDLEVLSRITNLISTLRYQYNGLSVHLTAQIRDEIREEIRKKDAQITLIDKSCLQIRIRSKNYKDIICIQMNDPEVKKDWLTDVRLAKLALDRANNPAWDIVNESLSSSRTNLSNSIVVHRVPLFVKSLPIFATTEHSQLTCALYYNLYRRNDLIFENKAGVLWICNVNENGSQLGALATNGADLSLIHSYELCDSHVTCIESVGSYAVWIGLRQGRIIVIDASSPGEWQQFATLDVAAEVVCIRFFGQFVFVGLVTGVVALFNATHYEEPIIINLAAGCPVTCLLPVNKEMFACCGDKIWCIKEAKLDRSYSLYNNGSNSGGSSSSKVSPDMSPEIKPFVSDEAELRPNLLAHCGIGLWVSLINSSIIKLYHTETFKHLQDVNVASNVKRVLNDPSIGDPMGGIHVTSMLATRGLLWIGTNVGVIVTLNLPRLQGVPLISGCLNVALHRHTGPVTILLSLTSSSQNDIPVHPNNLSNLATGSATNSNGVNDKTKSHEALATGIDGEADQSNEMKQEDVESIYGLYSDLMNVENYVRNGHESRQSNTIGHGPINKMSWELANINLSDDSTSESAIYQEGGGAILRKRTTPATLAATLQGRQLPTAYQAQQQMSPAKSQSSIYDSSSMAIGGGGVSIGGDKDVSSSSGIGASSSLYDIAPAGRLRSELAAAAGSRYELNSAAGGCRIYDTNGGSLAANASAGGSGSAAPKTALLLTGGNGYKRVTLTDAPTVSQHAHCCIWEYKL